MSDDKIPGVDYAALGRVLRRAKADGYGLRKGSDDWVVPVIAAYREQMRDQGVVEVKAEDVRVARTLISILKDRIGGVENSSITRECLTTMSQLTDALVPSQQQDKEKANS